MKEQRERDREDGGGGRNEDEWRWCRSVDVFVCTDIFWGNCGAYVFLVCETAKACLPRGNKAENTGQLFWVHLGLD